MLIYPTERLIVLAVPKTGTTALDQGLMKRAPAAVRLAGPQGKHLGFAEYRAHIEGFALHLSDGRPYEHFALFREPVAWLGSWYRYKQRDRLRNPATSTKGMTFNAFIEACLQPKPPKFATKRTQSSYVCDENGTLGVEHLFRYEDMERAVAFLSERLEKEIDLGQKKVSPGVPVDLAPELDAACRERFAREFEIHDSIG